MRPVRKADNLTTFMWRCHEIWGHSKPARDCFTFFYLYKKNHSNGLYTNNLFMHFFTLTDDGFPQKPKYAAIE